MTRRYTRLIAFARSRFQLGTLREGDPLRAETKGTVVGELIQCPYCGEQLEVVIDWSVARQEYIEDC